MISRDSPKRAPSVGSTLRWRRIQCCVCILPLHKRQFVPNCSSGRQPSKQFILVFAIVFLGCVWSCWVSLWRCVNHSTWSPLSTSFYERRPRQWVTEHQALKPWISVRSGLSVTEASKSFHVFALMTLDPERPRRA